MFNASVSNNSRVEISAVSGMIVKSHKKSYIRRMHIESPAAKDTFSKGSSEVVLQAMNTNDGYLLVEVIDKKDYEEE